MILFLCYGSEYAARSVDKGGDRTPLQSLYPLHCTLLYNDEKMATKSSNIVQMLK